MAIIVLNIPAPRATSARSCPGTRVIRSPPLSTWTATTARSRRRCRPRSPPSSSP